MDVRWRRRIAACISVIIMFVTACGIPVYAEHEKAGRETIRVGFYNSENYGYIGADGELHGYDIHFSKAVGMYAGFDTVMLSYDSVSNMEKALRRGDVDVLIDFLRTEKREKEFIFTNNPILEEQVSLYTLNDPDAPTADSIDDMEVIRVGYVSGSGFLDYFTEYCEEQGIRMHLEPFHDEYAMHSAMETGETDACLTGSAVPVGYRVLISSPPIYSYMMLRADDEELRSRIDTAISQLKTDDPDYLSDLYHMYVALSNTEMSPLTSEEQEYLERHKGLSVALVRDAEPFAAVKDDGSIGGVIPDYYRALGEKLGITFDFVAYDTTQDAMDAVAGGEADILGHYYGNITIAERDGLYDTMEYGTTECARLVRSGSGGEVRTAAVTNRTAYLLKEQLPGDILLKQYPNAESCYKALMGGDVDAMIGSMTSISWLVNQHTMRGVNLSILPDITLGIRGAVSDENRILMFLLNKAIAVSSDDLNEAIIANAVNGETDLRTALENLPLGFTATVVIILLSMVILLIVMMILLARNNRERIAILSREMNIDSLTGAGSRRYGSELLNRELALYRRYGDGPLIAMFDIDYFKEKNDSYGHEYGDFVLKKVVEVLRATLRQSDAIIRWGGDEFILVCARVSGDGADPLLEKVVRAVNSADCMMDGKGEQITVSVGASFFETDDEDINYVLRRCDNALYEAKSIRNTYSIAKIQE